MGFHEGVLSILFFFFGFFLEKIAATTVLEAVTSFDLYVVGISERDFTQEEVFPRKVSVLFFLFSYLEESLLKTCIRFSAFRSRISHIPT